MSTHLASKTWHLLVGQASLPPWRHHSKIELFFPPNRHLFNHSTAREMKLQKWRYMKRNTANNLAGMTSKLVCCSVLRNILHWLAWYIWLAIASTMTCASLLHGSMRRALLPIDITARVCTPTLLLSWQITVLGLRSTTVYRTYICTGYNLHKLWFALHKQYFALSLIRINYIWISYKSALIIMCTDRNLC